MAFSDHTQDFTTKLQNHYYSLDLIETVVESL